MLDQTDMNRPSSLNCPYCGNEAMPFFRFCTSCGLHLEPIPSCDNCYNFLGPTWVACAWCGHFSGLESINRSPNDSIPINRQNFYELRGDNRSGTDLNANDLSPIPEPIPSVDVLPEPEGVSDDAASSGVADDLTTDNSDHPPRGRVSDQISKLVESGDFHRQIGEYEKALGDYTELLELDPNSASSFYARAICYIELSKDQLSLEEKFDDAIKLGLEDFSKSIALDPNYLTAFRKETFYLQLGDRQMGVESYIEQKIEVYKNELKIKQEANRIRTRQSAIATNPHSYQSQLEQLSDNKGVISEETSESPREQVETISQRDHFAGISNSPDAIGSQSDLNDILTSSPDNLDKDQSSALYSRGEINQRLGEVENAIHDYSRAISLNPVFSAAFYARALCQVTLGKDELALEDFAHAIRLEPEYLSSLRNEAFYVNIGVRRAEVEEYISQRNNARTDQLSPVTSIEIPQPSGNDGIDSDIEDVLLPVSASTGVLGWVAGLTRKLYRK